MAGRSAIEECKESRRWYEEEDLVTEEEEDEGEDEDDQESPKSAMKRNKTKEKKGRIVHSQVLRIREEDSHVGEDVIMEIFSGKDDYKAMIRSMVLDYDHRISAAAYYDREMASLTTRPVLPCSPLSRKTTVN